LTGNNKINVAKYEVKLSHLVGVLGHNPHIWPESPKVAIM
jgi:hypothetical protein